MTSMAVPAQQAKTEDLEVVEPTADPVQLVAAELFAAGKTRSQIARRLEHQLLTPNQRKDNPVRRRLYSMRKVRRWMKRRDFRDLVYEASLRRGDMRTPQVVEGLFDRASNGRVDAAKFALELVGRYTPRGQETATQVAIVVNAVPRPQAVAAQGQRQLDP